MQFVLATDDTVKCNRHFGCCVCSLDRITTQTQNFEITNSILSVRSEMKILNISRNILKICLSHFLISEVHASLQIYAKTFSASLFLWP